jgi:hypothetical protein
VRSDGTLTRFEELALQVAPKELTLDQAFDWLRAYLKDEIVQLAGSTRSGEQVVTAR